MHLICFYLKKKNFMFICSSKFENNIFLNEILTYIGENYARMKNDKYKTNTLH